MPHNPQRGEMAVSINGLELVISPSFQRIANTEQALNKSFFSIADGMGSGDGLRILEIAVFFETMQHPKNRVSRKVIGEHLIGRGYNEGLEALGAVLNNVLMGESDGEDAGGQDGDDAGQSYSLPGESESGEDQG